jgi:hypothetical protein
MQKAVTTHTSAMMIAVHAPARNTASVLQDNSMPTSVHQNRASLAKAVSSSCADRAAEWDAGRSYHAYEPEV